MFTASHPTGHARHLPRPTRSAALFLLIALILELLGRLIGSTGVTVAAAAAVGAVISDAALTPRIDQVEVSRRMSTRLTAGIASIVRLSFRVPAGRRGAGRSIVVVDNHPAVPSARIVAPPLRPGDTAVADLAAIPPARGYWTSGTYTVEVFSPLGGFVRRCTRRGRASEVWVHPAPAQPFRLPDPGVGQTLGASSLRSGVGTDFFGIRDWRGGDPTTAVHWRASARRNQLVVMERERPAQAALVVVAGSAVDDDTWETAVARSAATAVVAFRSGRPVTLIADADAITPLSATAILDWFAALAPLSSPQHTALQNALRTAGAGATLLWLSSTPPPAPVVRAAQSASIGAVVAALGIPARSPR